MIKDIAAKYGELDSFDGGRGVEGGEERMEVGGGSSGLGHNLTQQPYFTLSRSWDFPVKHKRTHYSTWTLLLQLDTLHSSILEWSRSMD